MSAIDTAIEAELIASSVPLSEEAIDLLKTKLRLLIDQVALLESGSAGRVTVGVRRKGSFSKMSLAGGEAAPDMLKILSLFLNEGGELSVEDAALEFDVPLIDANAHFRELSRRGFVRLKSVTFGPYSGNFELTQEGSSYAAQHCG
jgi:hypothetical protein